MRCNSEKSYVDAGLVGWSKTHQNEMKKRRKRNRKKEEEQSENDLT